MTEQAEFGEPWLAFGHDDNGPFIRRASGKDSFVEGIAATDAHMERARRCVNALAGLPTDQLPGEIAALRALERGVRVESDHGGDGAVMVEGIGIKQEALRELDALRAKGTP